MANQPVTPQQLINAGVDAETIEDAVNGAPEVEITSRLGRKFWTLATFDSRSQQLLSEFSDAVQTIVVDDGVPAQAVQVGDSTLDVFAAELAPLPEKLARENVSVWDFFTPAELAAYQADSSAFDAYQPIQAFLDHISTNAYGKAFFDGAFYTTKGFNFSVGTEAATKNIIGSPVIQALEPIDTMLNMEVGQSIHWDGIVTLLGQGNQEWASRTCNNGVKIGNSASRARFRGVVARNFKQCGIYAYAGSTLTNFGDVRVSNIASGHTDYPTWNLRSNFSNVVNSGSSGVTAQYSTITVDTLPPEDLITECLVIISGQPYYVQAINRDNSTLDVFPWIDLNNTATELTYMFGAGVYLTSGDASVQRFTQVDAVRCGVAVWHGSLYPPVMDNVVVQYCGAGMILGIYPARAMVGGQVNGYYCENNAIDLLSLTRTSNIGFYINSNYAFNYNKVKYASSPRNTNNTLLDTYANLQGITIAGDNGLRSWAKLPNNLVSSTLSIDVTSNTVKKLSYSGNRKNINILAPNLSVQQAFGYDEFTLVYFGQTSTAPTGEFTFNAPSGYTVNGAPSAVFSGFSAAAVFHILLNVAAKNFLVSCSTLLQQKAASVNYDPPSIAAKSTEVTTVTLQGVTVGQPVIAAFSQYDAGIKINAVVSATDTITVSFENTTDTAIDLASGTLTVKAI